MNTLKDLAAYECFSSAHFPLELKVLCGDMLSLTLNWSVHGRNMNWLILLLCVLCEFPVSMARQQLVGSVSCLVFYLFHPDSPSFIFKYFSFDFWKKKKGLSDERGGHDHSFKRREREALCSMSEHLLKNIWFSGTKYSWFYCEAEWNSQWSQFRATAALIGTWFFFFFWEFFCVNKFSFHSGVRNIFFLTDLFLASQLLSLSTSQRQVLSEIPTVLFPFHSPAT